MRTNAFIYVETHSAAQCTCNTVACRKLEMFETNAVLVALGAPTHVLTPVQGI